MSLTVREWLLLSKKEQQERGYDAAVKETARLTDRRIELDEYEKVALDERLCLLQEHLKEFPQVTITYFQPDALKSGGSYLSVTGSVKKNR